MTDNFAHLERLTTEYLPAFLAFAIKNTNSLTEAEELAQETAFQCVLAINKADEITNFNAFIWSIAHNTYKRWCARKRHASLDEDFSTFSNIISHDLPLETQVIREEERRLIQLELSRQSGLYRKVLVYYYYDELSIAETAAKLDLSVEMVKFYLQKGRQKLKEAYNMSIGEKSFNPSEFSVYKSGIDFSYTDVWQVFKRKLPCQIALVCHDKDTTVSEMSIEIGVPAVYLEEEIGLLVDTGVMISPVKAKYRTNLHILKKNAVVQLRQQFSKFHEDYVSYVISAYEKYLPELKKQNLFKHDVADNCYAWFFADKVADFDYSSIYLSKEDYPQILSCGSKSFVYAEEAEYSPWIGGQTPTELEKCTVWPRDIKILNEQRHHQDKLWHGNKSKSQALYDVYKGQIKDSDKEIYAQLIEEGYVVKVGDTLYCNIAVSTPEVRKLFDEINANLTKTLAPLCKEIRENVERIVKATLPPQLKNYAKGFVETWIFTYSRTSLFEALYNKGFIIVPEKDDKTPIACYIHEN